MKVTSILYLLFIAGLLMTSVPLKSQSFHVTKNGDDDNSGSQNSPWESIQHAMDNATTGSTVFIHKGIYKEALYVNVSGNANGYITYKAFENDEVIIDAEGQSSTAIIELYGVRYISLENLILRNHQKNDAIGILIEGPTDHISIKDCEIHDIHFSKDPNAQINENTNAHAIAVYGDVADHSIDGIEIINNKIYDCRLGFSEALVVNGNVENFKIIGNEVFDVTNIGIDIIGHEGTCDDPQKDQARNGIISENTTYNCLSPYATSAGIYVDGGKDLIIERNRVHHNQWGIEIGCENIGKTSENIIVRNNLIYGNSTSGLALGGYDYPSGSGKVTNVVVVNNTLYGNDTENTYSGEIYLSYNENLDVFNNIVYGTSMAGYLLSTEDGSQSLNLNLSNNNWLTDLGEGQEEFHFNGIDYQGISNFSNGTGIANNSLSVDPNFNMTTAPIDFHLKENSLMIDVGRSSNSVGNLDFYGNDRVLNSKVDIGAHEFDSTTKTEEQLSFNIKVFPNPTANYLLIENHNQQSFTIVNIQGKVVYNSHQDSVMSRIDMIDWQNGIYFITFENGETQKFIKK